MGFVNPTRNQTRRNTRVFNNILRENTGSFVRFIFLTKFVEQIRVWNIGDSSKETLCRVAYVISGQDNTPMMLSLTRSDFERLIQAGYPAGNSEGVSEAWFAKRKMVNNQFGQLEFRLTKANLNLTQEQLQAKDKADELITKILPRVAYVKDSGFVAAPEPGNTCRNCLMNNGGKCTITGWTVDPSKVCERWTDQKYASGVNININAKRSVEEIELTLVLDPTDELGKRKLQISDL